MPKPVVTITTARKLSPDQIKGVKQTLKSKISDFALETKVDNNLMGGLKIQLGNQEFDASLSGKLERLQPQLPTIKVVTVIPLNSGQRQKIEKTVKDKFGAVNIVEEINPQILGGIKIITPSKEYDGSVQGKLEKLQSQMITKI